MRTCLLKGSNVFRLLTFRWRLIRTYPGRGRSPGPCIWASLCCAPGGGRTGTPARSGARRLGSCPPETSGPSGFPEPPGLRSHIFKSVTMWHKTNSPIYNLFQFDTYSPRPVSSLRYSWFSLQCPSHWNLCWPEISLCTRPISRDLWTERDRGCWSWLNIDYLSVSDTDRIWQDL